MQSYNSFFRCGYCGGSHSDWEACKVKKWYSSNTSSSTYYDNSFKVTASYQGTPPPKKPKPKKEDEDLQWLHDEVDRFVKAGEL